jgi:hypothetical protein
MFASYLTIALRFFWKQRTYSLINIVGLTIGIACSLFILLWIGDELQKDRFHQNEGRLFKVMRHTYFTDGSIFTWTAVPKPLAQVLEEDYPEVEEAELQSWRQQLLIAYEEMSFKEHGYFAGKDFFKIFSFPFKEGDPATALSDIHSIVTLWEEHEGRIIGVVEYFHFASMRSEIGPLFIRLRPENTFFTFIRTESGQLPAVLDAVKTQSSLLNPAFPFEYHFLDRDFEELYASEKTIGSLAGIFALVTVVISCLGLLGLASYTAEQRIKEISVRKVLGASVSRLVWLMSGEFSKLVLLAYLVGAPLAYYLMARWLESFAYRASLSWMVFVLAGLLALLIAWLTVAYQSLKAARCNPAEVLRRE